MYKLITEKSTAVPTFIKTWEKQFPVILDNWQKGSATFMQLLKMIN